MRELVGGRERSAAPWRGLCAAPLAALALLALCASASAASPAFSWTSAALLSPPADGAGGAPLGFADVSCAAAGLCVAVSADGHAFATTDPAAGAGAWRATAIDPSARPRAISCPSASLCVAVDDAGDALTSTDPGASQPSWSLGAIASAALRGISCPSASLCVAVDEAGDVSSTTDPAAGAGGWRSQPVDAAGAPLLGVSCPTASLCVALDAFGDVLTSNDPSGGAQAWSVEQPDGESAPPVALSCPSASLCLALDAEGNALASTAPADGAASWRDAGNVGLVLPRKLTCLSEERCVAIDGADRVATSDLPLDGLDGWTTSALDGGLLLAGVACLSVTRCVLVDLTGHALVGDAPAPVGTLAVTLFGEGDGTIVAPGLVCAVACAGSYARGSHVTLTAVPAAGSVFAGWGGACTGTAPCDVVVDSATAVTAGFALAPPASGYRLSVSIGGSGTVTGAGIACPETCATRQPPGTRERLVATPAQRWHFSGWEGACAGSANPCVLRATRDADVGARFDPGAPVSVRIRATRVSAARRSVRVRFTTRPPRAATVCALVPRRRGARTHWAPCRSPVAYAHLRRGRYVVLVRGTQAGAASARAEVVVP